MPMWDREKYGDVVLVTNGKGELVWEQATEHTSPDDIVDTSKPDLAALMLNDYASATGQVIAEWTLKVHRSAERAGLKYGDPGTVLCFVRTGATKPSLMVQLAAGNKRRNQPVNMAALRAKYDK